MKVKVKAGKPQFTLTLSEDEARVLYWALDRKTLDGVAGCIGVPLEAGRDIITSLESALEDAFEGNYIVVAKSAV